MESRDEQLRAAIDNYCQSQQQIKELRQSLQTASEDQQQRRLENHQIRKHQRNYRVAQNSLLNEFNQLPLQGLRQLIYQQNVPSVPSHSGKGKNTDKVEEKIYAPSRVREPIYADALLEVVNNFFLKICCDFQPQGNSLTSSLAAWVNQKLRLKYLRIDNLDSYRKRDRKREVLWQLLQHYHNRITVREFASVASLSQAESRDYLDEQAQKANANIIKNQRGESVKYHFVHGLSQQEDGDEASKRPIEGDRPSETGETIIGTAADPNAPSDIWTHLQEIQEAEPESSSIWQNIMQYVNSDSANRLQSCHPRGRPDCNCQTLLEKMREQMEERERPNFRLIAKLLSINYQTLWFHWERKCYPLLQTICIEQADEASLRNYIEQDPDGHLCQCHLEGYPHYNCQSVSQRMLSAFQSSPEQLKTVARDLSIKVSDLRELWEGRCLPILSRIAIEL